MHLFSFLALLATTPLIHAQLIDTLITSPLNNIAQPPTTTLPPSKPLQNLKRATGTCAPKPTGNGPIPTPDTQYAFLNSPTLKSLSENAPTPSNYTVAFTNLKASSSAANFLGYINLETYDTKYCAQKCNEQAGCQAINIFFERDPTAEVGEGCMNPPSTTFIKCAFWGELVRRDNTDNAGYTDGGFVVAIAGSNGYVKAEGRDVEGGGARDRIRGMMGWVVVLATVVVVFV